MSLSISARRGRINKIKHRNTNMSNIYEIPADEYNTKLAAKLKHVPELKMPEWAFYVKSGGDKSRPPEDPEFWFKRTASILRQIYIRGIVGVGRLRTKYGGNKNRGVKPKRFAKASGKMIRTILQSAEKAGMLEKVKEGKKFGRRLTKHGREFLEGVK